MDKKNIDGVEYIEIEDVKEKQRLLYQLMEEFHNICEKEGLTYNLYAGSLLGAVREGGIIPWDDDVDVSMPREDYNKLIKVVKESNSENFDVLAYPDKNYIYPYAKFCDKNTVLYEPTVNKKYYKIALYIDIFPLDGCPDSLKQRKKTQRYMKVLSRCRGLLTAEKIGVSPCLWKKPYVIIRWLMKKFLSFWGIEAILGKEVKKAQLYKSDSSKYIAHISMHGLGACVEKKDYYNRKLYEFGPIKCWGMAEYDKHLTDLYGNYMQRPPKEKQVCKHAYDLYLKKKEYGYGRKL